MDAVGYFCLTCNNRGAAQVADSHSPAFTQEQYLSSLCWNNTTRERENPTLTYLDQSHATDYFADPHTHKLSCLRIAVSSSGNKEWISEKAFQRKCGFSKSIPSANSGQACRYHLQPR